MARTSRLKITPQVQWPTNTLGAPAEARPRRRRSRTARRVRARRSGRTRMAPERPSICGPANTPALVAPENSKTGRPLEVREMRLQHARDGRQFRGS
eukprot:9466358-Pyramimonas_sp.AAC.1